ncbi:sarcosine dehydrogenase, mitochondrial-like [Sycon ciliatum]|uniref:sarcosine dehydrogenase, mitochondrial-like n=1 Tax=Sycon ciliatum TaxID=27933 RepID=UPI0031F6FBED
MAFFMSSIRIASNYLRSHVHASMQSHGHWNNSYRTLCTSSCRSVDSGVPYDTSSKIDAATSSHQLPSSADAVIIGGGAAGCSALYHLTKLGMKNVVLLERSKLTAGTTWHSAGLVWRLRPSDITIELLARTRDLLVDTSATGLQAESQGLDAGWIQNGGLFVANTKERLDEYKRLMTLGKCFGIESSVLSPAETKDLYPLMNVSDVYGTLYSPGDGIVEPSGITAAYGRAAIHHGAKIVENCAVTGIETKESALSSRQVSAVHTDQGTINTSCVVNCAGGWAPSVGAMAGVTVPLVAMKHAYVVTEAIEGIRNCPNVRDHDLSLYLKLQGDGLSLGGYENNPIFVDELPGDFNFSLYDLDWDVFSTHLTSAIHRVPHLENVGMKSTVSGPESFTADHQPLMGESPEVRGFYLSCGYNSSGIMLSGGCGQQIAEWIVHGKPSLDMFAFDIRRFGTSYTDNVQWCRQRSHESYAKNYSIVFPHDEPMAGRNLRKDPLHEELMKAGCVYQERHGWERPGWFMQDSEKLAEVLPYDYYGEYGNEKHTDYTYKQAVQQDYKFSYPDCFETIMSECKACREDGALFNMSYFGKFLLRGRDARKAADWLFTNDIGAKDRLVYTCMLNKDGGTESDLTVASVPPSVLPILGAGSGGSDGSETFYVACGGAVATYVQQHVLRVLREKQFDAQLVDVSDKLGLLSLQGPVSRKVLQQCTDTDLSTADTTAYGRHFAMTLNGGGEQVWAMRMSFVGEYGYELHVPSESLLAVYRQMMSAGREYGVCNAGYRAIDLLSAEQGYHHWHSDLRTTDTPVEAGLGFVCSRSKDYLGKDAVEQQRASGHTRQRICLVMDSSEEPLHGNEAVWCNGTVVSYVRRAGVAQASRQWLAFAYIDKPAEEKLTNAVLANRNYEIEQMGIKTPARAYLRSPFSKK